MESENDWNRTTTLLAGSGGRGGHHDVFSSTACLLQGTAERLWIRSEVESVLSSVVDDVEVAYDIQQKLDFHIQQCQMQQLYQRSQQALQEYHTLHHQDVQRRQNLGDLFVGELLSLSRQLEDMEQWKLDKDEKMTQFHQMEQQLVQTQEQLKQLLQTQTQAQSNGTHNTLTNVVSSNDLQTTTTNKQPTNTPQEPKENVPDTTLVSKPSQQSLNSNNEEVTNNNSSLEKDMNVAVDTTTTTTTGELVDDVMQEEEEEEGMTLVNTNIVRNFPEYDDSIEPTLDGMEGDMLMKLFEFLDAMDILNISLVNICLYSKIDALFGLGGVVTNSSSQSSSPSNPTSSQAAAATVKPTTTTNTTAAAVATTTTTKTTTTTSSIVPNVFPNVFGMLNNNSNSNSHKNNDSSSSTAAAATSKVKSASSAAVGSGGTEMMNATIANSLADKLSPAELSAIISMRSKLTEKESELTKQRIQMEDLSAQLDGVESVKEFLASKVKDTETELKALQTEHTKTTQKLASDQEVICFLDGRVQELERSIANLEVKGKTTERSLNKVQTSMDQKVTVLSDMLQFEREQLLSKEKEWKSTKKVLVKEVKNCRTQIITLQAEKDALHQQNLQLKEALYSFANNNNNNNNSGKQ